MFATSSFRILDYGSCDFIIFLDLARHKGGSWELRIYRIWILGNQNLSKLCTSIGSIFYIILLLLLVYCYWYITIIATWVPPGRPN